MARPTTRPRKDRQRRRFSATSRRTVRERQGSVDSAELDDINPSQLRTLLQQGPEDLHGMTTLVTTPLASSALPAPSDSSTRVNTVGTSRARDGDTKRYFQGYEYTRANSTSVKITYRCSFYRPSKRCPGTLVFYANTMTFDVDNMVSHTCRSGTSRGQPVMIPAISVTEEMKAFVDSLIEEDMVAKAIWTGTYTKFYSASARVVRGLSHKLVFNRVSNARASAYGSNVLALLESPALASQA
ncbi:hypothetical protein PPTG_19061 [Phytophthora nicotianae INRA-310]|uniref:FLYWCH-type domain-containing protein n=1 Tax=Phytophthora nicotianae (strain INRA-310) TaxID=761204 RepID=W2PFT9_PHYN3|nr:hypothetical protein PPTG_19061 [Phytophthora nicotianae INRA-310]ETM99078.1 hypothetical protein PPTG_19061 [Phytophthora nicotianae INRA-310]